MSPATARPAFPKFFHAIPKQLQFDVTRVRNGQLSWPEQTLATDRKQQKSEQMRHRCGRVRNLGNSACQTSWHGATRKNGIAAEANASVGEVEKSGYGVKTLTSMATSEEHPDRTARREGEERDPIRRSPRYHLRIPGHITNTQRPAWPVFSPGSSEPGV